VSKTNDPLGMANSPRGPFLGFNTLDWVLTFLAAAG